MLPNLKSDVIEIRKSIQEDVPPIASDMRESDVEEIWASNNLTPADALQKGINESVVCLTALYGDEPVAMFGLVPMENLEGEATIWFLSTRSADRHKLAWGRMSQQVVNEFHKIYSTLYNYVDVRNLKSIEWLKWLGAEFLDPAPYGVMRMPFQLFMLKEKT